MVNFTQKELESIYDVFYNHIKPSTNAEAEIQASIVDKIADELIGMNRKSEAQLQKEAKEAAAKAAKEAYAKVMAGSQSKTYQKINKESQHDISASLGDALTGLLGLLGDALQDGE